MNAKKIKNLDLSVYQKTLSNGLEVYIIPNDKVKNTYATYTAKYGGIHNEFVPVGEHTPIDVPMGIAHFLEHKMFESEDGTDVFKVFADRGSNCNANTGHKKTTYLFSGTKSFYENLEFLLTYVESPYFTDENVEKEKGIIEQEIMMYKDNPYAVIYEGLLYNLFHTNPLKYPTIGTVKSINRITKEDLYTCYNTFYHPSNMFIVVTGNVDPEKTMSLIEKHEKKRKIEAAEIKKCDYAVEKDEVYEKLEIREMPVEISKLAIGYKINIKDLLKDLTMNQIYSYLLTYFDIKFGVTSLFSETLRNKELIVDNIDVSALKAEDHLIIFVDVETEHPEKVQELIEAELKDIKIEAVDFERKKKSSISKLVYISDNIFNLNSKIMSDIIERGEINFDPVTNIRAYDYKTLNNIIKKINFDHKSVFMVKPHL